VAFIRTSAGFLKSPTERNQQMKNKKKKPQWRIVWELPNGSKMPGAGRFRSQKKAELAAAQHTYNYYFDVEEVPE